MKFFYTKKIVTCIRKGHNNIIVKYHVVMQGEKI